MNPHYPPQGAGRDQTYERLTGSPLPPPPPRDSSGSSQQRRNVARPLSLHLTTAVGPGQAIHSDTTPMTTTSLSGLFVQNNSSVRGVSAGAASGPHSRGVSPASNRMSGHFSVPYDPRQWSSGTPDLTDAQIRAATDEPLGSPPPPYSVPATTGGSTSSAMQPGTIYASPVPSRNTTPVGHPPNASEPEHRPVQHRIVPAAAQARTSYDPRRHTYYAPATSDATSQLRSHAINRSAQNALASIDTGTSNSNQAYGNRAFSANESSNPQLRSLSGQRPATEGFGEAIGHNGLYLGTTQARPNSSSRRKWAPGMPLPGPPPGPPPSSARSASASSVGDKGFESVSQRIRSTQLPLRESNYTATSSSEALQPPAQRRTRSGPPIALRIDTGVSSRPSSSMIVPVRSPFINVNSTQGSANLVRKPAVRDVQARVLRERQHRLRSSSDAQTETSAVSNSTNPWADALERANTPIEHPRHGSRSASYEQHPTDNLQQKRSHTPPPTPSGRTSEKAPANNLLEQNGGKVLPTPPLSQKPLYSANSVLQSTSSLNTPSRNHDRFINDAIQRYSEFLELESVANTEADKLQLFADFIHEESLIRKEKYWTGFSSGQFNAQNARDNLFVGISRRRASMRESENANEPPMSPGPSSAASLQRPETMWWKDYKPALSPIASMGYDEMSSRGRAPSRWFESQTCSQSDGLESKTQRSKRESKYMSLSKQLLKNMENEMETVPEDAVYDDNYYPDEKQDPSTFGYYDESMVSPPNTGRDKALASAGLLDVSRFVTLPPPYPRHYPAVNNSHPDLADYRNAVRGLGDLSDARTRQARYQSSLEALRNERRTQTVESKKQFRSMIQAQISQGAISFADAAEEEKTFQDKEHESEKKGLQAEFDMLQDIVVAPLHDQLNSRVLALTEKLDILHRTLVNSANNMDPDLPVQEGDDIPELLEQLTQYKWLFEAREHLHYELFKLLSQRNAAYRAIVVLPYAQNNNMDKVRDTESFFESDEMRRYAEFCEQSQQRHRTFLSTIEDHAQNGLEMQSSAFWDIAPNLLDLLNKIPDNLSANKIHIPDEEYTENPQYHEHPQQYLYSLLTHASKSAYQFIESQVNLLCLVHEVKTIELGARKRLQKANETSLQGKTVIPSDNSMEREEAILTEELKTRASSIEEQWQDAIGHKFMEVLQRVRGYLKEHGGFEEQDEADGVNMDSAV